MDIHQYFSELGKKSAARLTPAEREARAQKASRSRWSNHPNGKHSDANGKHLASDTNKQVDANGKHKQAVDEKYQRCRICNSMRFRHFGALHEFTE